MKKLLLLLSFSCYACTQEIEEESTTKSFCARTRTNTIKYHKKVVKKNYFHEITKVTRETK